MLVGDWLVSVSPTPIAHSGHRAGKAAFGGDLPDHALAVPRPPSDMGEAEKVEVFSFFICGAGRPAPPESL